MLLRIAFSIRQSMSPRVEDHKLLPATLGPRANADALENTLYQRFREFSCSLDPARNANTNRPPACALANDFQLQLRLQYVAFRKRQTQLFDATEAI